MSYPITEKLFKLESAANCGESDVVLAADIEKFLQSRKATPTDYGFDPLDELYMIRVAATLEPLTKSELLAVFEDFKKPQSDFTQPEIEMFRKRLAITPLEEGSFKIKKVVTDE